MLLMASVSRQARQRLFMVNSFIGPLTVVKLICNCTTSTGHTPQQALFNHRLLQRLAGQNFQA